MGRCEVVCKEVFKEVLHTFMGDSDHPSQPDTENAQQICGRNSLLSPDLNPVE